MILPGKNTSQYKIKHSAMWFVSECIFTQQQEHLQMEMERERMKKGNARRVNRQIFSSLSSPELRRCNPPERHIAEITTLFAPGSCSHSAKHASESSEVRKKIEGFNNVITKRVSALIITCAANLTPPPCRRKSLTPWCQKLDAALGNFYIYTWSGVRVRVAFF